MNKLAMLMIYCLTCLGQVGLLTRSPNNPIVPNGPPGSMDFAHVGPRVTVKDGPGAYRMWYEADPAANTNCTAFATSTDARNWVKSNTCVLSPTEPWEGTELCPESLLIEGGTYKLWYHGLGADGKRRIGYATSPDGQNWTKYAGNPVLDVGPAGAIDSLYVVDARVFNMGSSYRMYYGAMPTGTTGFGTYTLMHATSPDGITWTKQNQQLFGPHDNGYAILQQPGGTWALWYGKAFLGLGYATSPDGFAWTDSGKTVLNLNPDPLGSDSSAVGGSVSFFQDDSEFLVMYIGFRPAGTLPRTEAINLATIPIADPSRIVILDQSAASSGRSSEAISWTTDNASTGTVSYGTTPSVSSTVAGSGSGTTHSASLTGLARRTKYYYRINATNTGATFSLQSSIFSFTTN